MNDKQYNLKDIISTMILLNKFENDIIKKLELSKTQINDIILIADSNPFKPILCKIVNETYIAEIKRLFDYQKLKNIINKYQSYLGSEIDDEIAEKILKKEEAYKAYLFNKKNEFIDIKKRALEFYKIEKIQYINQNKSFIFSKKFNILDEIIFNKFLNILDLNEKIISNKSEEIFLTYNFGNIVFRGLSENIFGNYWPLLYIYSLEEQKELGNLIYNPEVILEFRTSKDIIKNFPQIMKENILDKLINNENYLTNLYNCRISLNFIKNNKNDDTQKKINDSDIYDNDKDNYLNRILNFSFLFCFKYNSFYDSIKNLDKEEIVYIINKKYIDEIKFICHFNEINDIIKKHKEIVEAFNKEDDNYLRKLTKFLEKNTLIKFFSTKKKDIKQRLNNSNMNKKPPKHLNNDKSNNLFYYDNCQIINKDLFNILNEIDALFRVKIIEAKAIYSNNKIILFLIENENYVINVGKINNNTDEFEIEYLIQSEENFNSAFDLKKIFGAIKNTGYNNFKSNIIKNDNIRTEIDHITFKAKIYRLSQEGREINSPNINLQKKNNISEKLKALILLSISQSLYYLDKFHENNKNNFEKVYLMDYNYLLEYRFYEILSLIF